MQQTFRARALQRYSQLAMLLLFLGGLGFWPWIRLIDAGFSHIWQGLLFGMVLFGSIILISLKEVLHSWRTVLTIDGDQIAWKCILRKSEFGLSDIIEVDWSKGSILTLKTADKKFSLYLNHFTPPEKETLVKFFHYRLPKKIQKNFARYCLRGRRTPTKPPTVPTEGFILITRRRIDWLFLPALFLVLLLGIVFGVVYGDWLPICFTFILTFFWVVLRWNTSSKGEYDKAIGTTRDERAFFWSILICLTFFFLCFYLIGRVEGESLQKGLLLGLLALTIAIMSSFGIRSKKAELARTAPDEESAIAEWEKLNPPPA